jgi:hypothetical protein
MLCGGIGAGAGAVVGAGIGAGWPIRPHLLENLEAFWVGVEVGGIATECESENNIRN